jgi:hypothetical protein
MSYSVDSRRRCVSMKPMLTILLALLILTEPPRVHTAESFAREWDSLGSDLEPAGESASVAGLPDPRLYPPIPIEKIEAGDYAGPRCLIFGKVTHVRKEDDGDIHFVVETGNHRVVCEIVPDLLPPDGKLKAPKIGDDVWVWGIPRFDGKHRWAEIHPVAGVKIK